MFFKHLIILQILYILTCKGIKSEHALSKGYYKALQNGAIYLARDQPLTILQTKRGKSQRQLPHTASKLIPFNGRSHFKIKAQKRLSSKGIQIPTNYIPLKTNRKSSSLAATRSYRNSKFMQNMPVFDAVPGEESFTQVTPIFICTGHKGRMLLNTMLSKDKYPMQEPVPGQVLYPPQSLLFKPKPLIENLQRKLNVTMIPFYASEAIDPTTPTSMNSFQPLKKSKKAKHYTAFFSPEQVHSKPATDLAHWHYGPGQPTTFTPPTVVKPYGNHRFENMPGTSTTPLPYKKLEVTYNDGEDEFQITYEGDNIGLERPLSAPATQAPLPYESYTLDDNYYAFPVYTMSKLLDTPAADNASTERQSISKIIDTALKAEQDNLLNNQSNEEDTWFILNSRYKGPLKKNNSQDIHSSKYIQTSPNRRFDTKTTARTTEIHGSPSSSNELLVGRQRGF